LSATSLRPLIDASSSSSDLLIVVTRMDGPFGVSVALTVIRRALRRLAIGSLLTSTGE
jgi:hypothetical protein